MTRTTRAMRNLMMKFPSLDLPCPWFVAGGVIHKEYHLPHLFFRQKILESGHGGIPGMRARGKTPPSFRYPPEHVRLWQLGDRVRAPERGRDGIEGLGKVAFSVEVVAVTEEAVLVIKVFPFRSIFRNICRVLAQGVFQPEYPDRGPLELDFRRRYRPGWKNK